LYIRNHNAEASKPKVLHLLIEPVFGIGFSLLFYHFLLMLSINLLILVLILFRIFHKIAENSKEVLLTIFIGGKESFR